MIEGTLFIVSAPSGAGKTSLVKALQRSLTGLTVSTSHTTRARRPGEEQGRDYFFIDHAEFERMIAAGAFLEYAEVFGHYYGTARHTVEQGLASGRDVLLEIDWQGAQQVRTALPAAVTIFVLPPSRQALQQRLEARGQDGPETIARRMREAMSEMSHYPEYDYLIINDDFDTALAQLCTIVNASRLRTVPQVERHKAVLSGLLAAP